MRDAKDPCTISGLNSGMCPKGTAGCTQGHWQSTSDAPTCGACGGKGWIYQRDPRALFSERIACPDCHRPTGTFCLDFKECDRVRWGKDPGGLPQGWDVVQKDNGTAWCLEGPWFNTRKEAIDSFPRPNDPKGK